AGGAVRRVRRARTGTVADPPALDRSWRFSLSMAIRSFTTSGRTSHPSCGRVTALTRPARVRTGVQVPKTVSPRAGLYGVNPHSHRNRPKKSPRPALDRANNLRSHW